MDEGSGFVGKRLGGGPGKLRGIDLEYGENADHEARENGG